MFPEVLPQFMELEDGRTVVLPACICLTDTGDAFELLDKIPADPPENYEPDEW